MNLTDYEKIDELFISYKNAYFVENNKDLLYTARQHLITFMYKVASKKAKYVSVSYENDKIHKYLSNPVIFIEKIDICLKKWVLEKECSGFAAYTFKSIFNALASDSEKSSFSEKTSGMKISDEYQRKQRKLKNLYKTFLTWQTSKQSESEINESFIKYATNVLDVSRIDVIDFLNPKTTTNLTTSNDEDSEIDLTDFFGGDKSYLADNYLKSMEELKEVLEKLNNNWLKQKDTSKPLMSELLTLLVLKAIEEKYIAIEEIDSNSFLECIRSYDFISSILFDDYFINKKTLPSQESIGEKYGLSKSGVSKKISRFLKF